MRPETLADQRLYLESGLRELACRGCGALVRVKKSSPQHTSIQWTARVALGETTALVDGCATLRETIDRAVREGRLEAHAAGKA
jgi:hypothetical protein